MSDIVDRESAYSAAFKMVFLSLWLVLVWLVVFALTSPVQGAQWGSAGCVTVVTKAATPATSPGWFKSEKYPGQWAYFDGKIYTVYFDPAHEAISFYDSESKTWTYPLKASVVRKYWHGEIGADDVFTSFEAQIVNAGGPDPNLPTGVMVNELVNSPAGYSVNGVPITGDLATQLVTEGIPDEAGKGRLTVIGSPDQILKVTSDLDTNPELAKVRDRFVLAAYKPDDWQVERFGLGGNAKFRQSQVMILAQAPDGRAIHAQYDYDGPTALTKALTAASKSWDANQTPDLRTDDDLLAKGLAWVQANPLLAGVLFLLVVAYLRKDAK